MGKVWNIAKIAAILGLAALVLIASAVLLLGQNVNSVYLSVTDCPGGCVPVAVPTSIILPTSAFIVPTTGGGGPLDLIDEALRQSIPASIAYNAPTEMQQGETVTIELLLNPSISEPELVREISGVGMSYSSTVEITPEMKAEILAADEESFTIRRIHDDPVQLISSIETTRWAWYVTAQKEGQQELTIVLYRLIRIGGEESWREVETYKSDIHIKVTLLGRLQSLGWGWIAAALLVLAGIGASWRRLGAAGRRTELASTLPAAVHAAVGPIFISYRRSDSADITGRIYDRLVDEFGRDPIFKDVDSIPLGVDFKEYLDQKVSECRVLLAVIGDRWVDARDAAGRKRLDDPEDFVRIEIESALRRDIPVIPLLVRGVQMPSEVDLPAGLQELVYRNGIPVRPDPDFHRDMDRLVAALKESI
ncbi:MAG TPA: toll/interleukin-1 receptor domain-containing protein [Anaerolineales bacterium]|nr:toll/interleukin-1 receptor domain-containing protein [Anaerolineales bacterium]